MEISSVAAFDDHVDIELALRNANLDSCKDALPSLYSSRDDEGRHEKQSDVCLPSQLNITRVVSGQASFVRNPTHPECFRQSGQDAYVEEEHNMLLDVVDYEMDVYEAAMCDPSDGGGDAFFCLEHLSTVASVPCDIVHLFFLFFHNVKMRAIPYRLFFFPYFFSIS